MALLRFNSPPFSFLLFVTVMYLSMLHSKSAILIHVTELLFRILNFPAFFFCFLLLVMPFPSQIRFHKGSVLNHAFLHHITFSVKLPLQFSPYFLVNAFFMKALTNLPHC